MRKMPRRVPVLHAERALFVQHVLASIFPRVLPWALLATAYTGLVDVYVTCNIWPSLCTAAGEPNVIMIHPYGYQAILLCTGYGLVLRLNQSYTRYWECRTGMQNAASKWADALLMACAFDDDESFEGGGKDGPHAEFAGACAHLTSLLHAVALHALRGDPTLSSLKSRAVGAGKAAEDTAAASAMSCCGDNVAAFCARHPICVLGGVTAAERARLKASPQPTHLVVGWLTSLMVRRRRRGGLSHDAPIVSRIYQVISDGNLWFQTALKVVDTPFPLVYAQFNTFTCLLTLAFFPVIIADKVASLPFAMALSFCAASTIFGLNEAAKDLEEPFASELGCGLGGNRLDAPALQTIFDERLLAVAPAASATLPSLGGAAVASNKSAGGGATIGSLMAEAIGSEAPAATAVAPPPTSKRAEVVKGLQASIKVAAPPTLATSTPETSDHV